MCDRNESVAVFKVRGRNHATNSQLRGVFNGRIGWQLSAPSSSNILQRVPRLL